MLGSSLLPLPLVLTQGKSHLTSNVPREIRIEKKGAAKLQETDPKQANRRFWIGYGRLFAYLIASTFM